MAGTWFCFYWATLLHALCGITCHDSEEEMEFGSKSREDKLHGYISGKTGDSLAVQIDGVTQGNSLPAAEPRSPLVSCAKSVSCNLSWLKNGVIHAVPAQGTSIQTYSAQPRPAPAQLSPTRKQVRLLLVCPTYL